MDQEHRHECVCLLWANILWLKERYLLYYDLSAFGIVHVCRQKESDAKASQVQPEAAACASHPNHKEMNNTRHSLRAEQVSREQPRIPACPGIPGGNGITSRMFSTPSRTVPAAQSLCRSRHVAQTRRRSKYGFEVLIRST
jgi:hypothetical protein